MNWSSGVKGAKDRRVQSGYGWRCESPEPCCFQDGDPGNTVSALQRWTLMPGIKSGPHDTIQ